MFADELRQAIEAAPRIKLPEIASLLWGAFAASQVTETEAEELTALIEARRAVQTAARPPQRRLGSRPRTSASMERRRVWAARSLCPPRIAACFTLGEQAVLAVAAAEVRRKGSCCWSIGQLAAVAGVGETTVKRAIREARRLGLLSVQERRVAAFRNETNVLRIVAVEWIAWLRLVPKGGGGQFEPGTKHKIQNPSVRNGKETKGCREKARGNDSAPIPGTSVLGRTEPFAGSMAHSMTSAWLAR